MDAELVHTTLKIFNLTTANDKTDETYYDNVSS